MRTVPPLPGNGAVGSSDQVKVERDRECRVDSRPDEGHPA